MDYEKKYKKAVNKIRNLLDDGEKNGFTIVTYKTDLESIFPELCESEDERIRKEIIAIFKGKTPYTSAEDAKRYIAWLEKQGEQIDIANKEYWRGYREGKKEILDKYAEQSEQKPADTVKPKFKVGDWVVSPNGVYWHIDAIQNGRYEVTANTGQCGNWPLDTNIYRLWTIQDAKDGDVLAFKNNIGGIIICKSPTDYDTRSYCRLVSDNLINKEESGWDSTLFVPATKEQRDLLFQKMKEAGYEWDADKKELKKISQRMISAEAKEAMYAKTAWSEDDEKMLVDAYVMLDWYKGNNWWTARRIKDWLETLKQRIGG